MNLYPKNLNNVLILSLFISFTILLLFSFGRNYGVHEDEGALLYYLSQGYSDVTFNAFHILPNLIGKLFNHSILGYRILNLVLLLICAKYATCKIYSFVNNKEKSSKLDTVCNFLVVGLFTLFFYCYIPTISYNSTITLAIFLWIGSFCSLMNSKNLDKKNKSDLVIFSLSIFMALSSRIFFGISLILLSLLISIFLSLEKQSRIKINLWVLVSLLISSILFYCLISFGNLIYLSKISSSFALSSHTDLVSSYVSFLNKYFNKIFPVKIFLASLLVFVVHLFLKFNTSIKKNRFLLLFHSIQYLSIIIIFFLSFKKIIKELGDFYVISGAPSSMSSQILLNIFSLILIFNLIYILYQLILYLQSNELEIRDLALKKFLLTLIIVLAVLSSPVGTNSNLLVFSALSIGPFSLPLVNFFRNTSLKFKFKYFFELALIFLIASSLLIIIYKEQILHYRRNAEYKEQTHHSISSSKLKNILIEQRVADNIDAINVYLEEIGFNYESDRLISYPDMPGYIAATNAKTYGPVWFFGEFSDVKEMHKIDIRNCSELINEVDDKTKYLYVILGGEFSSGFNGCFNVKFKKASNFKERYIGDDYNYFNKRYMKLRILGPYGIIR